MDFRFAGAIVTFLIGLGGPGWQAFAQYYSPQVYTAPRAYPDRSPPVDADGSAMAAKSSPALTSARMRIAPQPAAGNARYQGLRKCEPLS
jgi:hypothetical protein